MLSYLVTLLESPKLAFIAPHYEIVCLSYSGLLHQTIVFSCNPPKLSQLVSKLSGSDSWKLLLIKDGFEPLEFGMYSAYIV